MCGIAGYIRPATGAGSPATILAMTRALRHRGPDDEGVTLIDPAAGMTWDLTLSSDNFVGAPHSIAFGHRRFSILDLSSAGHQPFWSHDRSTCVIFNGEIYNYLELRRELRSLGHVFRTECDTEVLVEAWRQWGTACFTRFVGFWAVALYDAHRRAVLLCRDPIGKAPLYVARHGGTFHFGSEIAAILTATGRNAFAVRERAVADFMAHSWRDVGHETFYEGIISFPSGAFAWIGDDGTYHPEKFWRLPERRWTERQISIPDAAGEFRRALDESVRLRLRADVPIGFELSGGIDSSCLVASAASQGMPLHAYTVRFAGAGVDEEPYARQVAERYRDTVRYTVMEVSAGDFWSRADEFVGSMNEPFHAPNMITNRDIWQRMAADGIKVSINGAAGDESWAGYFNDYYEPFLRHLASSGEWRQLIRNCWLFGDEPHGLLSRTMLWRLRTAFTEPAAHAGVSSPGSRQHSLAHLDNPLRPLSACSRGPSDELEARLRDYMGSWRMNYWLRSGNQNFMSVPTEVRCPFLDHRLVELAFRLPVTYLIRDGWLKWLVRYSMRDRLPETVIWRKRKMGFPFPYRQWAIESREKFFGMISGVDCPYVDLKKLRGRYDALALVNPLYLWRIMSLMLWWKKCVVGEALS